MKKEQITSTRTVFIEDCEICKNQGKSKKEYEIKGFSESNLKYNMRLHKEKHDKEEKKK